MTKHFQLTLCDVFVYKQKNEKLSISPRTYTALSFKPTTAGRYISEGSAIEQPAGSLCLIPADVAYARENVAEDIYVFHFDTTPLLPREIRVLPVDDVAAYRDKFETALALWQEHAPGYYYRVSAILYELFAEIAAPMEQAANKKDDLAKVHQYMEEHFSNASLSIEQMARRAHVSPAYFRRRFAERYGTTPKQYLDRLRMQHAEKLLQTGYYSTREIAERCGFSDASYFCTAFRRHTGKSVTAYRHTVAE